MTDSISLWYNGNKNAETENPKRFRSIWTGRQMPMMVDHTEQTKEIIMEENRIATTTTGADMKMDKVRRLLGNRYGDDGRVAVMALLDMVLGDYVGTLKESIEDAEEDDKANMMTLEQVDLAEKCLKDVYDRASKEPVARKSKTTEE